MTDLLVVKVEAAGLEEAGLDVQGEGVEGHGADECDPGNRMFD